ncbi:MAG TPA: M64 family metallopeptidase [Ilumatobacteraceae bacterium]|nr:M64 family metallopeptidase [Ilumatobacteraceae bacterium]
MADSVTQLRNAGPVGQKKNIAIIGDGFTAADQTAYNNWVTTNVLDGLLKHDYYFEDASAFNVYRINLESVDSGVSTRTYDLHGTPNMKSDDTHTDVTRNTPLQMIFSGTWLYCWMEYSAGTDAAIKAAIKKWVPDTQFTIIVLNTPGFGGCGGGGRAHVTLGTGWTVLAHELGHGMADLADEYSVAGNYTDPEPGRVNVTINTNRATTKWGRYIAAATPVPTGVGSGAGYNQGPKPAGWSDSDDAGIFEGGNTNNTGVYRPVINCRMNGNSPPFCPVCYTAMKSLVHQASGHNFQHCVAGDFNGDGRSDVLVHSGNSIQIFRSNGSQLDHVSSSVERVPGSWQFQTHDQFYVGDFNGDGKDEVVVFNGDDWVMPYLGLLADDGANGLRLIARYDGDIPGWGGLAKNDKFYVGDFNGDGKDDLYVFNGLDWSMTYVAMLRSTGTGFTLVRRFDGDIPGWGGLAKNDQLHVGDFDGDGKDDLYIFNGPDWSMPYVGMFRASASNLTMVRRFDGDIPGWGGLAANDQLYVGDFNNDGRDDLYIFNGPDWSMPYLGMFRSNGSDLLSTHRYDGDVPGWGGLAAHDRFIAADVNGDGKTDLIAINTQDWAEEYLGRMISNGSSLGADFTGDWVGEWNLGPADLYESCNASGGKGQPTIFIHNTDWFGTIDVSRNPRLQQIYFKWIHNYRHGRHW